MDDDATISAITEAFDKIPELYIADGHHRTAAAALVGNEKARLNPQHRGDEEYNYFLAVAFPASHLKIIDYNRVVKDLNGLSPEEFLERLGYSFEVHDMGTEPYTPARLHNFSLYLEDRWYSLTARPGTYDDNDPIGSLDVTVSSDLILRDILGITDLRSDKRIDFVGGIRGLGELKRRVDSGEMAVALALFPVSMEQLMRCLLLVAVAVAAHELVHAACGVDELLLAGEEGVRSAGDFKFHQGVFNAVYSDGFA